MKEKIHIVTAEFGLNTNDSFIYLPKQNNVENYEITTAYYNDQNTYSRKFSLMPLIKSKIPKMLEWMDTDADYYIWMDASFKINSTNFVYDMLKSIGDSEICLFKHPYNSSIKEEVEILEQNINNKEEWSHKYVDEPIKEQIESYLKDKDFIDDTLFASGLFIYSKKLIENRNYNLLTDWFLHTCYWSNLCQVSLPYLIKKHKTKYNIFEYNDIYTYPNIIYLWDKKIKFDKKNTYL